MEVRRLGENDLDLLVSAIQRLVPEENRRDNINSDTFLHRALRDKSCYFIVGLIDSVPVGYLSAYGMCQALWTTQV
jgi:hypothetical protein